MLITIIDYDEKYVAETVAMWRASKEAALGQPEKHDVASHQHFLQNILPTYAEIWLAQVVATGQIVGLLALSANRIEQLYIDKDYQQKGIGSRLMGLAKERYPQGLTLYTMAENIGARAFYERHGFTVIAEGWAEEEEMADVLYEWGGVRVGG
ncbi:MAG TPA: GNAT family N-acetyltransferase [Anaerolineae bacterium]|nr:GNAT family N-acetyltransferase [Anaerolineae bacterium]